MCSLSIIIVNWNAGRQLRACIASIDHACWPGLLVEVIVVDNKSTDDSLSGINQLGVKVRIILNSHNRGFAAACNQGAAEASSDYLLFLNPDTRLYENSLSEPIAFMQNFENRDVGAVGIQLLNEKNEISRSCARFPTLGMFVSQALGLSRLPSLGHLNVQMEDWAHDHTRDVDHVIGAFYMVRRSLFELLTGFDERFFVYLEDLDFSLRISRVGQRIVYFVKSQAFHIGGGTSAQVKDIRLFYSLRSRLIYGFKYFSTPKAWILLLVTLLLEPWARLGFSILKGSWAGVMQTGKAYILLIKNLKEVMPCFWR